MQRDRIGIDDFQLENFVFDLKKLIEFYKEEKDIKIKP